MQGNTFATGPVFHDPLAVHDDPCHTTHISPTSNHLPHPQSHYKPLSSDLDCKVSRLAHAGDEVAQLATWGLECMYNTEEVVHLCAASAAETALVQASGRTRPKECWGCHSPSHLFRECPQKRDL
jgi:hypothetical protein